MKNLLFQIINWKSFESLSANVALSIFTQRWSHILKSKLSCKQNQNSSKNFCTGQKILCFHGSYLIIQVRKGSPMTSFLNLSIKNLTKYIINIYENSTLKSLLIKVIFSIYFRPLKKCKSITFHYGLFGIYLSSS